VRSLPGIGRCCLEKSGIEFNIVHHIESAPDLFTPTTTASFSRANPRTHPLTNSKPIIPQFRGFRLHIYRCGAKVDFSGSGGRSRQSQIRSRLSNNDFSFPHRSIRIRAVHALCETAFAEWISEITAPFRFDALLAGFLPG
jgi:hypothetical protein